MRPLSHNMKNEIGVGPTKELSLRVSVATLSRVLFTNPEDGQWMLALERKATLVGKGDEKRVRVIAQPFGGAVRILDHEKLRDSIGNFHYDSVRSREENDFRIFINPSNWPVVRDFGKKHLKNVNDAVLETNPGRELLEEFQDCLKMKLTSELFSSEPVGLVCEETPTITENPRASGQLTARVYRIFETKLTDDELAKMIIANSGDYTDNALRQLSCKDFQRGGQGRANGILAVSLKQITDFYSAIALHNQDKPQVFDGHQMSLTVLAVLDG